MLIIYYYRYLYSTGDIIFNCIITTPPLIDLSSLRYNDFFSLDWGMLHHTLSLRDKTASMTYKFQVPSFWPFNSNLFDFADFKHGLYLDSWGEIMFFRFRQKIKNELWLVIRYLISHVSSVILSGHFSMLKENDRERSETQVTLGPGNNFPASDNYY